MMDEFWEIITVGCAVIIALVVTGIGVWGAIQGFSQSIWMGLSVIGIFVVAVLFSIGIARGDR